MQISIRAELRSDCPDISQVNDMAFGRENESLLVEKLRRNPQFVKELSLVALFEGMFVGHILFFPVRLKNENSSHTVLSLGPMAVMPEFQGMGIGGKLIEAGFKVAGEKGFSSVIVLGHETYYPGFGFHPASLWNIRPPFEVPDGNFMAFELETAALSGISGIVDYPAEFDDV